MKKIFVEIFDTIVFAMDHLAEHRWITNGIMAFWFILTIVLNTVYMGKPVPVTGMILKTWMAYVNVISCGACAGFVVGYVNHKAKK